jgi:glycine/D-amino acid oxidase-like deaminating enzyme
LIFGMKLKSGCILWPKINRGIERAFSKLEHDLECEVAVIGGGISGALTAYYVARAGMQVVMVDGRAIGHGSTAASTGLLRYEIDTPLSELCAKIGLERARIAYQASLDALLAFEPLISELGDSCGLRSRASVYLASMDDELKELGRECEARRAMGIQAELVDRERLAEEFNLAASGAIVSHQAFEVDPYRLTLTLIDRAIVAGLSVFDRTEIASLETRGDRVVLCTAEGFHLTSRRVVIATGYETIVHLPPGIVALKSTYAVASQPGVKLSAWPGRFVIWETARPYLYARTTQDDRVVIGGADEAIVNPRRRDALIQMKAQELANRFGKWFGSIAIEPDCAWAGTFAETPDGLPYIGTLPQFPNCYFALGYGGNGITFSLLAAEIFRDLFLGRKNPVAPLFRFDR